MRRLSYEYFDDSSKTLYYHRSCRSSSCPESEGLRANPHWRATPSSPRSPDQGETCGPRRFPCEWGARSRRRLETRGELSGRNGPAVYETRGHETPRSPILGRAIEPCRLRHSKAVLDHSPDFGSGHRRLDTQEGRKIVAPKGNRNSVRIRISCAPADPTLFNYPVRRSGRRDPDPTLSCSRVASGNGPVRVWS